VRIGFFGTPDLAARYLQAVGERYPIAGVVTQPDRPRGRSSQLLPSPVKEVALDLGAPVFQPESGQCPQACQYLEGGHPDVCVVVAFGQKLPCGVRECAVGRCINVHYSLLPKLRGAAPVQHALLQGLTETGVTVQYIAPGWDEGDIILQRTLPILPADTCGSLTERLTDLGVATLLEALELLAQGNAPRVAQDHSQATYAPLIKKEDGVIDWRESAEIIARKVRAFNPWPAATTTLDGRPMKILAAHAVDNEPCAGEGIPGTVVEVCTAQGFSVCCGRGTLSVEAVQPSGKRAMDAATFLRGARLQSGTALGGDLGAR
jgi:methionyl-tRNA formyltransferase